MKFDTDKLMQHVKKSATDHVQRVLEQAKRDLGPDGQGIEIGNSSGQMSGSNFNLGNVKFPSEDVKERFLAIVKRRMGS